MEITDVRVRKIAKEGKMKDRIQSTILTSYERALLEPEIAG